MSEPPNTPVTKGPPDSVYGTPSSQMGGSPATVFATPSSQPGGSPTTVFATPSSQMGGSPTTVYATPGSRLKSSSDSVFNDDTLVGSPAPGFAASTPKTSKTGSPGWPMPPTKINVTPRNKTLTVSAIRARAFSFPRRVSGDLDIPYHWSYDSEDSSDYIARFSTPVKYDPLTRMTEAEKKTLLKSWHSLVGQTPEEFAFKGEQFGIDFLHWMFDNVPNMKKTFKHRFDPFRPKPALSADPEFQNHSKTLVTWLESMITLLFEPTKFRQQAAHIANVHLSMPGRVGMAYFGPMEDKFPAFMACTLGKKTNDPEVRLWNRFMGLIVVEVEKSERYLNSEKCCSVQ
ncbi:uncharacterized protein LOC131948100 [Physella acuta]|uniref:uncharacterized protein LOC131948100 n=1 Tax=Physella acuta TaxID=109671 RepID=UPI0027DE81FC|nr:uncharacterized protein LOC131948100 [Physella acuta]